MVILRFWVAGLLLVVWCGADRAYAQGGDSTGSPRTSMVGDDQTVVRRAVEYAKEEQYDRAIRYLDPLARRDSLSLSAHWKSKLYYWLGFAYQKTGRPQRALEWWQVGVTGQIQRDRHFSFRLADAFIRAVMWREATPYYGQAAATYLGLLERLDGEISASVEQEIVVPHLRELTVVLPSDVQRQTGLRFSRSTFTISVERKADAGRELVQWWRKQDPVPSTEQNERLFEHLRRASYARREYAPGGRIDDRARVFIRFGKPHRSQSVGMADQETTARITTPIRRNEFWTYPHIDEKAYYLFVERQPGRFELGETMDLFPPSMMAGPEFLYELEEVLRELATFHGDYSLPAADVFARAAWSRDNQQYNIGSDRITGSVEDFLQKMEDRIETVDRQNAERRRERMPTSYTETRRRYPKLPIAVRTARYLTARGKTRLEVYWGVRESVRSKVRGENSVGRDIAGAKSGRDVLLATLVQEDRNHVQRRTKRRRYHVNRSGEGVDGLRSYSTSIVAADSVFHVAAQWDEYRLSGRVASLGAPQLARRTTIRFDTLSVLSTGAGVLEMSDLQFVTVPSDSPATNLASTSIPYPFDRVEASRAVGLRFEIYHLAPGNNDQSRYRVSYVVGRKEKRGFFGRLFSGREEETAVSMTNRTDSTRSTEYILLDLENMIEDEETDMTVGVTVTDEVSGQSVTRSISFQVVSSPPG